MIGYYSVKYVDDHKQTHLTVAKNSAELAFIKDRFDKVDYELVIPAVDAPKAINALQNILAIL